jgi:hypothetical protein
MDEQMRQLLTPQFLRRIFTGLGVGQFIYGVAAIVLGSFVRRGSWGATMTGTILTGVILLGNLLFLCSGFVGPGSGRPADAVMGACMMLLPFALFVWQLIWLIQALKSGSMLQAVQGQMQMQYWQYAQMQQQYQQAYQAQMSQNPTGQNPPPAGPIAPEQPPASNPPQNPPPT